jgi:hypothetical protein
MLVDDMAASLEELTNDLEAELIEKYGRHMQYPHERSRFERDMQPVLAARRLLAIYRGEPTTP